MNGRLKIFLQTPDGKFWKKLKGVMIGPNV